ncbi:MAG: 50S ribosomal protein L2 [Nanoarchaeota archaeon]
MGKTIIQQARGHGSMTYQVRKKAYIYRIGYPRNLTGIGEVARLFNSSAHSTPMAEIRWQGKKFYIPAFKGMYEGQEINFNEKTIIEGNILKLKDIPINTNIYCIESRPNDGGVFVRTSGNNAVVNRVVGEKIEILMPSKKGKEFNENCRAVIGVIAGAGRLDKPFVKAGSKFFKMKARNKFWPRTSAVKFNAIDHPFGSGRGKRIKSKIAKRNAPPGAKVGLIRPKRTGRKR